MAQQAINDGAGVGAVTAAIDGDEVGGRRQGFESVRGGECTDTGAGLRHFGTDMGELLSLADAEEEASEMLTQFGPALERLFAMG